MSQPFQSICILGRQPALGLAELESLYGAASVSHLASQVAGLSLQANEIEFSRLGGSTRLAEVLTTLPTADWKRIERGLSELIIDLIQTLPDGKIQLGLSAFGIHISPAKLSAAGLTLKKTIRTRTNRSARVTPNPELELNTAQVLHNHLTGPTGIELLIIATDDNQVIVARTSAVQNIDSYTSRDRGRPKRDARVGMLPPKLAQIIINLAMDHSNKDGYLLDPFCGTGVILQEAALMDIDSYGTDLEARMVTYTKENLTWLDTMWYESNDEPLNYDYLLEVGDATSHKWKLNKDRPIRYVASETYLGRPFTEKPSSEMLARTASEVNLILKKFLQNIHPQLPLGARLCIAIPAWQMSRKQFKHLPLIDQLNSLGYNQIRFEHVRDEQLLYYREDQIVARELIVLIRK